MTVLVVDDSRIMRNVIKKILAGLATKVDCLEAGDGREAYNLIQTRPVDLALLDWNMPELSGIDFLRLVRGQDTLKNLPVVMITSEAAKYSVIEALKAGATDYIVKPVEETNLRAKIKRFGFV